MNTYHRFLLSLLTEFRRKAEPHIQSLGVELMELEGAINEDARSVVLHQALRRIHFLGRAAGAANARKVQALCQTLEFMPAGLMHAPAPVRPRLFDAMHQTMNALTKELDSIDSETSSAEHDRQGTEAALAGFCAD